MTYDYFTSYKLKNMLSKHCLKIRKKCLIWFFDFCTKMRKLFTLFYCFSMSLLLQFQTLWVNLVALKHILNSMVLHTAAKCFFCWRNCQSCFEFFTSKMIWKWRVLKSIIKAKNCNLTQCEDWVTSSTHAHFFAYRNALSWHKLRWRKLENHFMFDLFLVRRSQHQDQK